MFSLSSNEERNFRDCSPSKSSSSIDDRSSKALEAMLREHDEDSIIIESSLPKIRATYRILGDLDLHILEARQRPFDPFSNGFSLSVDALEVEMSWVSLTLQHKVCTGVYRGILSLPLAKEIYTTPSEVLVDNAAKNLVTVEEDPYANLSEDDIVSMEVAVPLDDIDPPIM
ncbi:hypothetical protein B296_00031714 [Ensete ventricosum]|uniref:Uncharacterized protein n=1 Tax=Ensete ventricosum TaxID=4639 RepID=A0A426XU18_ENSVE|nr:hypothetical protein B296_00031714 [Ensete ventricosum]